MIYPLTLPPLPYSVEALQPVLSGEQVDAHYTLNHKAYVDNANRILAETGGDFGSAPSSTYERFVFNRNGALLHDLWWKNLAPGGERPTRELQEALLDHGHISGLISALRATALKVQGSGWACLSKLPNGRLHVHEIRNHEYDWDWRPLLLIDVWEHAYYLNYFNDRQAYVDGLLNLIDWRVVESRLVG